MSVNEIALVVGAAAAGIAAGSLAVYFNERRSSRLARKSDEHTPDPVESGSAPAPQEEALAKPGSQRVIPKAQLEKSKRELRTLLLEKELVSAALTRLYEAEAAKEITQEERELLGSRYRDELKALDDKIGKTDAFIEVGDLETLREQLLQLVNQKIDAIDKRIERTRLMAEPLIAEILKQQQQKIVSSTPIKPKIEPPKPKVPDISDLLKEEQIPPIVQAGQGTPVSSVNTSNSELEGVEVQPIAVPAVTQDSAEARLRKKAGENSNSQVEELQKELLEALDRLEKLDVES